MLGGGGGGIGSAAPLPTPLLCVLNTNSMPPLPTPQALTAQGPTPKHPRPGTHAQCLTPPSPPSSPSSPSPSPPRLFSSRYGSHDTVSESTDVPDDYLTVAPVRYPVSRFVSAVGELMERSMNHYCPSGYCQTKDSYDNETLVELSHQTTW